MNFVLIVVGKFTTFILKMLGKGSATALPGLIALKFNPHFCHDFKSSFSKGVILVSGTNGKTTTTSLIAKIIGDQGFSVINNIEGSNLLRGIASVIIKNSNLEMKIRADYGVFEVDEAALPFVMNELQPKIIVLNNLFRDQLDRYGELDNLTKKWCESLQNQHSKTQLILNADDPVIACLNKNLDLQTAFYGITDPSVKTEGKHYADSTYCPICLTQLNYKQYFYSHLGLFSCPNCKSHNPLLDLAATKVSMDKDKTEIKVIGKKEVSLKTNLIGTYNVYNILAAYLTVRKLNLDPEKVSATISAFQPSFGRQEIIKVNDKNVFLLLSKNPTGFSQSIETIALKNPQNVLMILNDKIADGEDVSWIADIDFSPLHFPHMNLTISGTRAYDMALRLKYEMCNQTMKMSNIETDIKTAIFKALTKTPTTETLYILSTYTAMLEVRKILTGSSFK